MEKQIILIVEDEEHQRNYIRFGLEQNGFFMYEATTGEEALELLAKVQPHLVLLDLNLPGINGHEVCRLLKENFPKVGIVMLTACNDVTNKIKALDIGADDYIVKPFDYLELVARIKAVLRRLFQNKEGNNVTYYGGLEIFQERREVRKNGKPIELTPREFDLLVFLLQNPNRVHNREELLNKVWGPNYVGEEKIVDIYIKKLREKLEDNPSQPCLIKTVRGVGYQLKRPLEGK